MSNYFFSKADRDNKKTSSFINELEKFSEKSQQTIYVLDKPLTDNKYFYDYKDALIVLCSKKKIAIVNFNENDKEEFNDFVEDVIEDLGSISDKYNYKKIIGRPRKWRKTLLKIFDTSSNDISNFLNKKELILDNEKEIKDLDLLISLFIGSINDIDRVKYDVPTTLLDKVKQKIQLFDSDQTRFIYDNIDKPRVRIQGLSGTGKTELLLHKLKDIYINEPHSKVFFTCHNKILANSLKRRIPQFFNFMKVEQQIEWDNRLWCTNAWGSKKDKNSGLYSYLCDFYDIPCYSFRQISSFSHACELALNAIKEKYEGITQEKALSYIFIDESQDFDEHFFALCEFVTEKRIYIAGDVFQSIFDEEISSSIKPDFLLGKCYRTAPNTLMFAHALGMGLFEKQKLRWLEEKEWKDCGYNLRIEESTYNLSREPLRRFEDLDDDYESIAIVEADESFSQSIIDIINEICFENETVKPDDIAIIFLDNSQLIYRDSDTLEYVINTNFDWNVNKAYDTKQTLKDTLLISNRNNVKGLEFPFVICITREITNNHSYRNSLYTMLTRSFIKSYFLIQKTNTSGLTNEMKEGLKYILENKEMCIKEPSKAEKENISTRFENQKQRKSQHQIILEIFKEHGIQEPHQNPLLSLVKNVPSLGNDKQKLESFITQNLQFME